MISYQTYNEIHVLFERDSMSYARIASQLHLCEETVSKWARRTHYQPRKCAKKSSILDSYKPVIRRDFELVGCSASAILKHIRQTGYTGGIWPIKAYLRSLRAGKLVANSNVLMPSEWMLRLLQGKITSQALAEDIEISDLKLVGIFVEGIRNGPLRARNRLLAVVAHLRKIPARIITRFLMIDKHMVGDCVRVYERYGIDERTKRRRTGEKKHEQQYYKNAVFALLHSPPHDHGVNRTSWRMDDIIRVMHQQGVILGKDIVRRIIKDAGFRFRAAKRVLTSTDPEYKKKLTEITRILSSLTENERFFSIDEYGPFCIKIRGGRALTAPGEERIVPQWQKSRGRLTLIAALELSTNQITHFYADRKSTVEIVQLMHVLLLQYHNQSVLYLSWDAASWHASKAFFKEVNYVNSEDYRKSNGTPVVALVPLPSCAQFLNVIESVFSGMAKAIIHNSDYASAEECKIAIDLYLAERNIFFQNNPKRAGKKIWGKERVPSVFSLSNNCKDPNYR